MNLVGVAIQLTFPCAPPWYENMYGLAPANYSVPGSPAGLAAIDKLLGIDLYTSTFTASPMVFGAFPSLHSGSATIEALFMSHCFPKLRPLFIVYTLWLWWATMYLSHHYAVDLVGGSLRMFENHLSQGLVLIFSQLLQDVTSFPRASSCHVCSREHQRDGTMTTLRLERPKKAMPTASQISTSTATTQPTSATMNGQSALLPASPQAAVQVSTKPTVLLAKNQCGTAKLSQDTLTENKKCDRPSLYITIRTTNFPHTSAI